MFLSFAHIFFLYKYLEFITQLSVEPYQYLQVNSSTPFSTNIHIFESTFLSAYRDSSISMTKDSLKKGCDTLQSRPESFHCIQNTNPVTQGPLKHIKCENWLELWRLSSLIIIVSEVKNTSCLANVIYFSIFFLVSLKLFLKDKWLYSIS